MLEILAESHGGLRVQYLVFFVRLSPKLQYIDRKKNLPQLKEIPSTGTRVVTSK